MVLPNKIILSLSWFNVSLDQKVYDHFATLIEYPIQIRSLGKPLWRTRYTHGVNILSYRYLQLITVKPLTVIDLDLYHGGGTRHEVSLESLPK